MAAHPLFEDIGRIMIKGTGEELARNDAVCRSYVGMT
jgi:hypothetical protein